MYLRGRVLDPSVDSPGELPFAKELCASTALLRRLDERLQPALVVVLDRGLYCPGRVAHRGREIVIGRRHGCVRS